jgi:hypothetical protein
MPHRSCIRRETQTPEATAICGQNPKGLSAAAKSQRIRFDHGPGSRFGYKRSRATRRINAPTSSVLILLAHSLHQLTDARKDFRCAGIIRRMRRERATPAGNSPFRWVAGARLCDGPAASSERALRRSGRSFSRELPAQNCKQSETLPRFVSASLRTPS